MAGRPEASATVLRLCLRRGCDYFPEKLESMMPNGWDWCQGVSTERLGQVGDQVLDIL